MSVDGEPVAVRAGATLVLTDGAVRGLQASERIVFLAVRVMMNEK
jgi:hypothetical protein